MLLRNLAKYQISNLLIYTIIALIFWIRVLFNIEIPGIYQDPDPTLFYQWITNLLIPVQTTIIPKLLAMSLVVLQGFILIGILNQFNLIGIRTYLPGILFMLFTSNLPQYQVLSPLLIGSTFILLAWNLLVNIDFSENRHGLYFNTALFTALATLFYPNFIYFLLIIISSTFLNRVPSLREFGMIISGFLMVWYFYVSLFFIFENHFQIQGIATDLSFNLQEITQLSIQQNLFFLYYALLIAIASLYATKHIGGQKIQLRRNQKFLFLWFILGLLIFIFTKSSYELIYFIAVPTSIIISFFLASPNYKWLKEFAFFLLLIISVINQFFPEIL